jgi:lipopolysaccharide transport system ATP-binding protein
MNGMILGLKRHEVEARLDGILAFADIGDFAFQPVKTYSSGMFVRLAFAVATSVEPDVLVIDEALSVGDGAFARKSFDKIMGLKDAGKTIVFCSHSMYQVEALCSRALWIEGGRVKLAGSASEVASAYQASLNSVLARVPDGVVVTDGAGCAGRARILKVWAESDQAAGTTLTLQSGVSDLTICVEFEGDPALPPPGVAIGFSDAAQLTVTSVISVQEGVQLHMDAQGRGVARVRFTRVPLLRGRFTVSCFLTTEDGVHPYDLWERCVALEVQQQGAAQGLVMMPHVWID